MRILICAAFYPPYRGGYAESVKALAEGLARNGHTVTVIACGSGKSHAESLSGMPRIISTPSWNPSFLHWSFPLPRLFSVIAAFRAAMRAGQDIVYTNTRFFPITWIGFLFAKLYSVPVIHIERGASHPVSHNRVISFFGKWIDHTFGRITCSFSDHVVGVSDAACAFARSLGARRPVRIHTGIDAAWWRRPDDAIPDPCHIAYVGRLVHGKGVQDLLRAVAALREDFPHISLSVAGNGPYRGFLGCLASELGIQDRISFVGNLDTSGIRDLLWRSAILANPSHSEGLPRAVLEAAAAGVPIVATDVGGTREIVAPDCGILVPPGDISRLAGALRRLISDPGFSLCIRHSAYARIDASFSSTAMIGHYNRIMHLLCAASRE